MPLDCAVLDFNVVANARIVGKVSYSVPSQASEFANLVERIDCLCRSPSGGISSRSHSSAFPVAVLQQLLISKFCMSGSFASVRRLPSSTADRPIFALWNAYAIGFVV